jgi:hypothetical protein
MEHVTYEQAVETVQALLPEDRQRLQEWLAADAPKNGATTNGKQAMPTLDRAREMRWLADEQNRAQYGGQWVALASEQVVSHGEDLRQVYAEAQAKGVRVPFTSYVEPLDALPFGGW